ncbi:MAG: inositol monophosphatase family protein [Armatimonadota bacterium]|nr:inositol monophosphatase family protein [Armatimonadota bacterium]MDR7563178.1 inositol monophosphatase family protein [Armatimonadota bacterium]MDR7567572.1 inositol monophosphatase family protein [Armatimonadota bacterium]MDR7602023.1 inositol monophosphatase family protein [Armatimonadota bacterium]
MIAFSPAVDVAVRAAREAGHVLLEHFLRPSRPEEVRYKGPTSPVTEADYASEACIVSRLREAFPEYGIVAEESGGSARPGVPCWYVDPLDGTTNFAHRLPWFAVSIALAADELVQIGVVYHPILDELFVAEREKGAWLIRGSHRERLRVSRIGRLDQALVATGTPPDIGVTGRNLPQMGALARAAEDLRLVGSAALGLAYVAAGRLDAFWEPELNPWDVAAGTLLVQEAGGTVTGMNGSPYTVRTRDLLATNGLLHEAMLRLVREA